MRTRLSFAGALVALTLLATAVAGDTVVLDLSHPVPVFAPTNGDFLTPDLSMPFGDSVPHAGLAPPATRLPMENLQTEVGFFRWGWNFLFEHYGTHVDSTDHWVIQFAPDIEVPEPDSRSVDQFTGEDLIGPIVFIDISSRVQAELDKNGGVPSPDTSITDFGDSTVNTVTVEDIDAVEDELVDRAWVVVHSGWDQFFFTPPATDLDASPYVNQFNHPGFHQAVIDRLIEIEREKGIRINGITMDNIGLDSGESARGPTDDITGRGWYAHRKGLQRGWKFIENGANLGQLAEVEDGSCTLFVGALKIVSGKGSPSRLLAICDDDDDDDSDTDSD